MGLSTHSNKLETYTNHVGKQKQGCKVVNGITKQEQNEKQKMKLLQELKFIQDNNQDMPRNVLDLITLEDSAAESITCKKLESYLHSARLLARAHHHRRKPPSNLIFNRIDRIELDPCEADNNP
jgi:hypothetical protein